MTPLWFTRDLSIGDEGPDVTVVRRKLGLDPDGVFDHIVAERIRGMARKARIESDGSVDAEIARTLGESAVNAAGLTPEWFHRDLQLWFEGEDVRKVRKILGMGAADNRYDPDCEAAVRRYQSACGVTPNGLVDAELAKMLGEAH